jgi:hypothetical protein
MIEYIQAPPNIDGGEGLLAIVIHCPKDKEPRTAGAQFVTDKEQPLQLGVISYKAGQSVNAHVHYPRVRVIERTQEVLFIRSGIVTVYIYTGCGELVRFVTLKRGDCVMFVAGGHGLYSYDNAEIIEVKTGGYIDREHDKLEFPTARDYDADCNTPDSKAG